MVRKHPDSQLSGDAAAQSTLLTADAAAEANCDNQDAGAEDAYTA